MKVKMPMMSIEARGRLGGLVFNTNKGRNYVKQNTSPTGQGTAKRLAAQALLTMISRLWKDAGDVNRALWNDYAQAHTYSTWDQLAATMTGQNWFMRCNIQLQRQGNALLTAPPTADAPDCVTGLTLSKDVADLFIDWTAPVDASLNLLVHLTGPNSAGVAGKVEMAQFEKAIGANAAAPLVLRANAPVGRWTAFAKVMDSATGLCSPWVSAYFDMTA